jgi:hypothetical protein
MGEEPEEVEEEIKPDKRFENWTDFFVGSSPGTLARIEKFANVRRGSGEQRTISFSRITIHCPTCDGERTHFPKTEELAAGTPRDWIYGLVHYLCQNCFTERKTFAIRCRVHSPNMTFGHAIKVGEWPPFGAPIPARVITLVGPDRDNFLKGRRCESQGLGVGAFAYYRRVIEDQKDRLISEIIRVANSVGATELIPKLESAKLEKQFTTAIDTIKPVVPESLKIDGHNPLTLLHNALSKGLHARSDEECLQIATAIRVVLFELSERMSITLKEQSELQSAVSTLLNVPPSPSSSEMNP